VTNGNSRIMKSAIQRGEKSSQPQLQHHPQQ